MNEAILREAARNKNLKSSERIAQKAMEEDPTVFDYDGFLESKQEQEKKLKPTQRIIRPVDKKSKYMETLLDKADERKRVNTFYLQKKYIKEAKVDADIYGKTDEFITPGYKEKLLEDKKWREERDKKDAMEQDVTKKGDFSGYFNHLLKDNVSMGGGPRDFATRQTQTKPVKAESIKDEPVKDLYSFRRNNDQDNKREKNERREPKVRERREPNSPESKKRKEGISYERSQPEKKIKVEEETKVEEKKTDNAAIEAARQRYLTRKK